jgi:hypothetical protein
MKPKQFEDTNFVKVPKFIEKKYGLEVCTKIYLVEIWKEAWNATSFLFFPNPSFVAMPCHQSDIILFPSIRSFVGRSISRVWWQVQVLQRDDMTMIEMYKKLLAEAKFEKLGLFFVLSNVMCWVWVWVGFFFLGFCFGSFSLAQVHKWARLW